MMSIHFDFWIAPLLAWIAAGTLKFMINSIKARRLAFDLIGYGGMPSSHSAIVSSTAALTGLRTGFDGPEFGIAFTLALIVVMDARGLRRHLGQHAVAINRLLDGRVPAVPLRERLGHTTLDVISGIAVGILVAGLLA